jgi:hypothetical protein
VSEIDGVGWHAFMSQVFLFFLFQSSEAARGWCSAPNDKVEGQRSKPGGSTAAAPSVLEGEMLYKVLMRNTADAADEHLSIRQITTDRL